MTRVLIGNAWLLAGSVLLGACSSEPSAPADPTNEQTGTGAGTGGATALGGGPGVTGTGGQVGTGTTTGGGGGSAVGGTDATGVNTGGTGVVATGGTTASVGGTNPTLTGGTAATVTGGAPGQTGGGPAQTGGAPAETGGAPGQTGGAPAETGGAPAQTGGTPAETGGSTGTPGCDRAGLEAAAESYVAALTAGDPAVMQTSASVEYVVNDQDARLAAGEGLFQYAQAPDFHRNLLDTEQCRTFTEVLCASWSHPYVLGVALTITDSAISKVYVVETDDGDWLFDASKYLTRSEGEDWSVVTDRLTREELDSGAKAYFAFWGDKNTKVPWGDPCARLEGGSFGAFETPLADTFTTDNLWGSCSVGIPDQGFAPQPRESIIDPDIGAVVLLLNLGGTDSHLFRMLRDESLTARTGFNYGMVYVHTLTQQ